MGIYEGTGQLSKTMRELLARWDETKMSWDDAVSRRFEEKYLVPLRLDVREAVEAMSRMAALLDRIRRECT